MLEKFLSDVWHREIETLLKDLGTHAEQGLSPEQIPERLQVHGRNILKREASISQWVLFFRQFKNPMVYLLGGAALFSLMLGEAINALAIFTILMLNAVIGFIQEAKAQTAIEALKKLTVPKTRVVRQGEVHTISSEELTPGDILHLEAGDFVPADSRVLHGFQLTADESSLTGESLPVKKMEAQLDKETVLADRKNMLHAGSAITAGSARAVVTHTGMQTQLGQIAGLLNQTQDVETPLQQRLKGISHRLIILCVAVIIIVMILRAIEGQSLVSILMDAISLAVAGIPEGLPTVVTLALAMAVRRMVKRNAIVKDLAAVETLGSTTIICTDKTGTLTTGKMSVRNTYLWLNSAQELYQQAIVLCNNASLAHGGSGDTTEVALLNFARDQIVDIAQLQASLPRVHEWSFDSDRKRMSVAVQAGNKVRILSKGAPESILPLCSLTESDEQKIKAEIDHFSSRGERLLALACRELEQLEADVDVEQNLQFLGIITLADPPKQESMEAIKECQGSGIKVAMITGDHPITARAIATELGIVLPGKFDQVLTGKELDTLSDNDLKLAVERTSVYARVSPAHKMRIVEALQANREIVAMTGDGVNDAPALKRAEIGVAMGKAGTEVARQAANMILTDDNFATIVKAVEEGRAIYGNIRRTIQYQLSTNMAEILMVLGASILTLPVPFTPIGLLWINLVTDGLPSLALAAEPVSKDGLVGSAPSPSTFIDKKFILEMAIMGLIMTVLALGVYHYQLDHAGLKMAKSYAFTMLVYLSLFRSFSCRSEDKSYFQLPVNFYHLISVVIPILLQVTLQHSQLYHELLQVEPLSAEDLLKVALLSAVPVTGIEIWKLFGKSHSSKNIS